MDKKLKNTYYDPKKVGSFSGKAALVRGVPGVGNKRAEKWLQKQNTYTLHKPIRKKFERNKTIVTTIDEQFQADLVDMAKYSKDNDGIRYLLVVVDVFSRYCWIEPLKNKFSASIIDAFKNIFASGRKCLVLQTDLGTEFLNKPFQNFLRENDVEHFSTKSETKASIVERLNRTIKSRMWRYFTYKNTYRYIDVLQKFVLSYNNTYHRIIKRSPASITQKNVKQVWLTQYADYVEGKHVKAKFKVQDKVRISKMKLQFDKGYLPNWSEEVFEITKVIKHPRTVVYKLKDLQGDHIDGIFYEWELQKVTPINLYRIEKVLHKKGRKLFVKWLGYPEKFNSYIEAKTVKRYQ